MGLFGRKIKGSILVLFGGFLLFSFFLSSPVFGQTTDISSEGTLAVPDISKEGIGSTEFYDKGKNGINFLEKLRLNLKTKIEAEKNKSRLESAPKKTESDTPGDTTAKNLESAQNNFLYYFLVFALYIVSQPVFFSGLIILIALVVLKTFLAPR